MWAPILSTALAAAQMLMDRKQQRQAEQSVPVQLLTDGYFEAMADDIHGRMDQGKDLKRALREIYREQGPVLLRPAPKRAPDKGWLLPASVAAVAILGLAYWRRR